MVKNNKNRIRPRRLTFRDQIRMGIRLIINFVNNEEGA